MGNYDSTFTFNSNILAESHKHLTDAHYGGENNGVLVFPKSRSTKQRDLDLSRFIIIYNLPIYHEFYLKLIDIP